MIRRPGFGVVTFVVSVLVTLGVVAQALRPRIPLVPRNAMKAESEPFLRAGQLQPIPWHPLSEDAFREAQDSGRPLLVFIGLVTSQAAREADAAFNDPDVSRYVARQFVPVRIDGLESPPWVNAILPIGRLQSDLLPEAQIWVLSPTGAPIHQVQRSQDHYYTPTQLSDELRAGITAWRNRQGGTEDDPQAQDIAAFAEAPLARRLSLTKHRDQLLASMDTDRGGFNYGGVRNLRPLAYEALLKTGNISAARNGLTVLLSSPLQDVLFGGFFHSAEEEGDRVDFDKWTVENAEMAVTLATAYRTLKDPVYAEAAVATIDNLTSDLAEDKFLRAGEIGNVDARYRSPRHSFSPQFLRDRLSADENAFASEYLGLDPNQNPQGVPMYRRKPVSGTWGALRAKLRGSRPKPRYAPSDYAGVQLGSLARLIEAARLLEDRKRLKRLVKLLDTSASFFLKSEGEIRRKLDSEEDGLLCDYLGVADAKLQDYLATGRYESLQEGMTLANTISDRFRRGAGHYTLTSRRVTPIYRTPVPEIADNLQESSSAAAARVFLYYGRLFADKPIGQKLLKRSREIIAYNAAFATDGGPATAGMLNVALETADPRYMIVVGPRASSQVQLLTRRRPLRFIAAAEGDVRADLAAKGDGIYIVGGGSAPIGPLGLAEATATLPATYKMSR